MTIFGYPGWTAAPLLFLVLGLGAFGYAGWAAWDEVAFRLRSVETTGRILRAESYDDGPGIRILGFTLPDGTAVEARVGHACLDDCAVGREVGVRYDPADPADARLMDPGRWVFVVVPAIFGLGFTFLGRIGLLVAEREALARQRAGSGPRN